MRLSILIILLLITITGKSQSSYSGYIGEYPITLVMYHYSDGISLAYYAYDKYDSPITINGNLEDGRLELFEKDENGKTKATLVFDGFDEKNKKIEGKWISADRSKVYPILLSRDFSIGYGYDEKWTKKELLQSESTKDHYFKTMIVKEKDRFYGSISGVRVYEKQTDRLIQTLELDCALFGIDNLKTEDYNFDGIEDFSVFEASYAGPNTSSIYVLRDPKSDQYFISNFRGTSLEFDQEAKRIYEHNQCCAGRSVMTATYKVVNNEMILTEEKCLEYNDEKEDYIEVECD